MKITEVLFNDSQALFEILNSTNDTEFLTEDLVKVVQSKEGPWSEPVDADESIARMKSLLGSHGIAYK
jgi:hypothetical protein